MSFISKFVVFALLLFATYVSANSFQQITADNSVHFSTLVRCVDSDARFLDSTLVSGQVMDSKAILRDYCVNSTAVNEYFCSSSGIDSKVFTCRYGCENRACKRAPIQPASCVDSDGTNYYTRGFVTVGRSFYIDSCRNSTHLLEYVCSGNLASQLTTFCAAGCQNSTCLVPSPQPPAFDELKLDVLSMSIPVSGGQLSGDFVRVLSTHPLSMGWGASNQTKLFVLMRNTSPAPFLNSDQLSACAVYSIEPNSTYYSSSRTFGVIDRLSAPILFASHLPMISIECAAHLQVGVSRFVVYNPASSGGVQWNYTLNRELLFDPQAVYSFTLNNQPSVQLQVSAPFTSNLTGATLYSLNSTSAIMRFPR